MKILSIFLIVIFSCGNLLANDEVLGLCKVVDGDQVYYSRINFIFKNIDKPRRWSFSEVTFRFDKESNSTVSNVETFLSGCALSRDDSFKINILDWIPGKLLKFESLGHRNLILKLNASYQSGWAPAGWKIYGDGWYFGSDADERANTRTLIKYRPVEQVELSTAKLAF